MRVVNAKTAKLDTCLRASKKDQIVLTRNGRPLAVLMNVSGMDLEQLQLGLDKEFWKMIRKRRRQKTITHAELKRRLAEWEKSE
jgi:prevent-host-death family protein